LGERGDRIGGGIAVLNHDRSRIEGKHQRRRFLVVRLTYGWYLR
jgi:hypothetical protein